MTPRTGRPKTDNPMNERLYIRCSKDEKESIMNFAKDFEVSLLELIKFGIEKIKSENKK